MLPLILPILVYFYLTSLHINKMTKKKKCGFNLIVNFTKKKCSYINSEQTFFQNKHSREVSVPKGKKGVCSNLSLNNLPPKGKRLLNNKDQLSGATKS